MDRNIAMAEGTWWHGAMNVLASRLAKGVLNEMKRRVINGKIQNQKLQLTENTQRMRAFFEREIARYNKRKQYLARRQAEADNAAAELDKLQEEAKVMRVRIEKLVKQNRDLHKQVARTDPILKKIIEVIGIEQLRRIMTMKKNNMKKVKHLPLNNVSERCPKRSHA